MWTCSRLLRSPSLHHPPAFVRWSCKHYMSNSVSFAFIQIGTVWRNDRGNIWWLCSPSRHSVRDFAECTALLLTSWLPLEYKTEAHKLHREIEWYFYVTNRELSAYTDKHCDFLSHSTFLRAMYTAARLAITAPANSPFCPWTRIFRRGG